MIEKAPKRRDAREVGKKYLFKNEIRIWNGQRWHCIHNREKKVCVECGGSQICEHGKVRHKCKLCGGSQICEHNRQRSACKICKGSQICEHNRFRPTCKECNGSSICIHGNYKQHCIECSGVSICIHGRQKSKCVTCSGCVHGKLRSICRECNGGSFCIHEIRIQNCYICNPNSAIANNIRNRITAALKGNFAQSGSAELLGCSIKEYKQYLENLFLENMDWNNFGEWEIHHRRPCASFDLQDGSQLVQCFHYTNTEPLWKSENRRLGDKFDPDTFGWRWTGNEWEKIAE